MKRFMVGGLAGFPIGLNVMSGMANLAQGRPFGEITQEAIASAAFIVVGGVAVLMARYLPDWFNVIEAPPQESKP